MNTQRVYISTSGFYYGFNLKYLTFIKLQYDAGFQPFLGTHLPMRKGFCLTQVQIQRDFVVLH